MIKDIESNHDLLMNKSVISVWLLLFLVLFCVESARSVSISAKIESLLKNARNKVLSDSLRLKAYDEILNLLDIKERAPIYYEKGLFCRSIRDYRSETNAFHAGFREAHPDSLSFKCRSLHNAMGAQLRGGAYKGVFDDALKIIEMRKPDSLCHYEIGAYLILSDTFVHLYNYDKGKEYVEKAREKFSRIGHNIISEANRTDLEYNILMAEGNVFVNKGEYDKALEKWQKAKSVTKDSILRGLADASIGLIFLKQGDCESSIAFLEDKLEKMRDTPNGPYAALNYVYSLVGKNDYESAKNAMRMFSKELAVLDYTAEKADLEDVMAKISAHYGDYVSAFDHMKRAYNVLDSLGLKDRVAFSTGLDSEILQWEKERVSRDTIKRRNVLVICLVFLSVLLIIALILHKFKKKLKDTEQEKCALKESLERSLEIQQELKRMSYDSNKQANIDLSCITMELASINETMEAIHNISSGRLTDKEAIKKIRNELVRFKDNNNIWELFKNYFEKLNQDFFDRLYLLHPDLTNAEVRMCAFIMMNLTSKEIASMTNRSPRTIHCIKYNIRQKFRISESTEDYLRMISSMDQESFKLFLQEINEKDKASEPVQI